MTKIRVIIPEVIEKLILNKIKKARRGSLFFIEDFITKASNDAIRKALERSVKSGELQRIATGIYVRPEKDPIIGFVTPGIETIAKAIVKRDKARIVPSGVYALNQLGSIYSMAKKIRRRNGFIILI